MSTENRSTGALNTHDTFRFYEWVISKPIVCQTKPKTSATLRLFIHTIFNVTASHTHTIEDLPTETTEQLFHHQEQLTVRETKASVNST